MAAYVWRIPPLGGGVGGNQGGLDHIYTYIHMPYISVQYIIYLYVYHVQAYLNDRSKCIYVSSDHISELSIVYRYIGDISFEKAHLCWDMLSIWEVSLPGKAIHENATPARELWYWFDRLQECLSNSHLQVSYRTTTCRQCKRASPERKSKKLR